VGKAKVVDVIG